MQRSQLWSGEEVVGALIYFPPQPVIVERGLAKPAVSYWTVNICLLAVPPFAVTI